MSTQEQKISLETSESAVLPEQMPRQIKTGLILLSCCVGLLMTGFGIIVPVFPQRLESLGLGADMLATMEGAFGLGMLLFSTPMGTLADRTGRKPVVLLSLAGFILTNIVLALVNVPLVFVLIRFIEGVLVSGLFPASSAMVGDTVPVERQGRWIGLLTTAQAAGIALGPAIGGFLYQAWGFSAPFLICAGIAVVASLLAFLMLPETLPAQVREQTRERKAARGQGRKMAVDPSMRISPLLRGFALLLLLDVGLAFIYPFVLPQYPFFFEKVLHYGAAQYGLIYSAYGLSLAVFPILLGRAGEVFPKKHLVVVGSALSAMLNVAMLLLHNYALLIIASLLTGLGSALLIPALGVIYLGATNDHNRSQIMGIRGTALSLGSLLGPLLLAIFARWLAPEISFAIGALISIACALLAIVAVKQPAR
jgi:DHA1 family multidrug resistance protein-like MFS transporter